jgi:stage II sporulation protein GA (sporulation sigma-E factor processing peptidase)
VELRPTFLRVEGILWAQTFREVPAGLYLYLVMLLNFLVNLLLLLAVNRLSGWPCNTARCLGAASVGGLYGGACMLRQLGFLSGMLWHLCALGIIGLIAFGFSLHGFRHCALFTVFSLAMEGVALGMGSRGSSSLLVGAVAVLGLCFLGFRGGMGQQELVEVELTKGEKHTAMLALRDTGNTLRDPVTGQSVLIADHRSAAALLGLTRQQLRSPVETVASGVVPGLRLIPYHTVGSSGGMLVAIRLERVRIGKWKGSSLVAFAPEGLGGTYRALTGGMA